MVHWDTTQTCLGARGMCTAPSTAATLPFCVHRLATCLASRRLCLVPIPCEISPSNPRRRQKTMQIEEPTQKKRHNDTPNSCCCNTLANAVENLGCMQYEAAVRSTPSPTRMAFTPMRLAHSTFYGATLPSLRGLLNDKLFEHLLEGRPCPGKSSMIIGQSSSKT